METDSGTLHFAAFQLDRGNRQLRKHGRPIELGSRYFDALALLASRRGELVTKDMFMDRVWHGIPVTDEALTQCIRTLRRTLGDDAANPRFIETVPKHGYRFIAEDEIETAIRLRTQGSRVAGACTVAGLASGIVAGLLYGMIAATGGGAKVLVLAAMIGALGLLAGAGLGTGMAATLMWRGRADRWIVAGTAIGGFAVGALGNLLGREGVALLSGVSAMNVTGPFEGVVLGIAAGLMGWTSLAGRAPQTVIAVGVLAGAGAAAVIFFSEGTLLAGSLQALEQSVAGTQLRLEKIAMITGGTGVTRTTIALTIGAECLAFVLSIGASLLALRKRQ